MKAVERTYAQAQLDALRAQLAASTGSALVLGRYRIDAVLGEGSMGIVLRGERVSDARAVAVKIEHIERARFGPFDDERRALLRLDDAHLPRLIEAGRLTDGRGVLVCALFDGVPLDEVLRARGATLPWTEALPIVIAVLDGLASAHRAGVFHRDVKPSNILVLRDPPPIAALCDFGIARLVGDGADERVMGTLAYMSPEQCMADEVDVRSDLYSAGMTLFTMLAGRVAFDPRSVCGVIEKVRGGAPAALVRPASQPEWPEDLTHIVECALRPQREARFVSAGMFSFVLRALLDRFAPSRARAASQLLDPDEWKDVVMLAARLPSGAMSSSVERRWIDEACDGLAYSIDLGGDDIGLVLSSGGTGESAAVANGIVALLGARYGARDVVRERVRAAGVRVDVSSLVPVSLRLLAALGGPDVARAILT